MSYFIVLEGIDGSGKSSIGEFFKNDRENVLLTREPTDRPIGRFAQKIAHEKTSPFKDLFLYLADRVEHTEVIEKKLDENLTVICDRYWGSTAAYQAAYEEIELDYAEEIQKPFVLEPDITFLFDLDPKISVNRLSEREEKSKYEKLDFLKKVRQNYLTLAERHDWKVIDAEKSLKEVKKDFLDSLEDFC